MSNLYPETRFATSLRDGRVVHEFGAQRRNNSIDIAIMAAPCRPYRYQRFPTLAERRFFTARPNAVAFHDTHRIPCSVLQACLARARTKQVGSAKQCDRQLHVVRCRPVLESAFSCRFPPTKRSTPQRDGPEVLPHGRGIPSIVIGHAAYTLRDGLRCQPTQLAPAWSYASVAQCKKYLAKGAHRETKCPCLFQTRYNLFCREHRARSAAAKYSLSTSADR